MKSVYADLGNRSILVSGGATGIGTTIEQAFAKQGAKVALVDVTDIDAYQLIKQSQCLPDPVLPEHIAQMALFLASDAAQLCTAQNFIVDGGWA